MNSWEIIKEAARRPKTQVGSTGELVDIHYASRVYMALRHKIKDRVASDAAFNADELISKELLIRNKLQEIGMI